MNMGRLAWMIRVRLPKSHSGRGRQKKQREGLNLLLLILKKEGGQEPKECRQLPLRAPSPAVTSTIASETHVRLQTSRMVGKEVLGCFKPLGWG